MQTLTFLMLALAGQASIYVPRERRHFWRSLPAPNMLAASGIDAAVVTYLALGGILTAGLPAMQIAALWLRMLGFTFGFDTIK
jgi:H+-transporting ATPase